MSTLLTGIESCPKKVPKVAESLTTFVGESGAKKVLKPIDPAISLEEGFSIRTGNEGRQYTTATSSKCQCTTMSNGEKVFKFDLNGAGNVSFTFQ